MLHEVQYQLPAVISTLNVAATQTARAGGERLRFERVLITLDTANKSNAGSDELWRLASLLALSIPFAQNVVAPVLNLAQCVVCCLTPGFNF